MRYQWILALFLFLTTSFCLGQTFQDRYKQLNAPDTLNQNERIDFIFSQPSFFSSLIGCKAPDFEAVTIDGQKISFANLKGKVVVLVFWSIACKPCRVELPAINKLADEFKGQQVVIIGISDDSKDALLNFLTKQTLNIPILEKNQNIEDKYFAYGYPLNFIIDKKGIVNKVWNGGTIGSDAEAKAYEKFKLAIRECL